MLELRNITKRFNLTGNKEDLVVALDNVSLTINPGEFVTIIGGNGSGKSTTMNIISGVLKPDSGSVCINGVDITNLREDQRAAFFGRVFQDPMVGTAGEMSVIENLELAYRRGRPHSPFKWGFSKAHKQIFIEELKRFDLGLENKLNQKVGTMSGGQRQALTLLMATLRNKELADGKNKVMLDQQILLLDEHTAALDPKTAKKVLDLTEKIVTENHMTTLMVTHNLADALRYGNRLIMFDRGHIIHDFNAEEKAKLKPEDLYKMFSNY